MKWAREVKNNITAEDAGVMNNFLTTIHIYNYRHMVLQYTIPHKGVLHEI